MPFINMLSRNYKLLEQRPTQHIQQESLGFWTRSLVREVRENNKHPDTE